MHVHLSVLGAVQLRKFQQNKMYVHACVCVLGAVQLRKFKHTKMYMHLCMCRGQFNWEKFKPPIYAGDSYNTPLVQDMCDTIHTTHEIQGLDT